VSDEAIPPPDGDAPLQELSRDALSAFLYAALLPAEALALVKSLRLSAPGFRAEGLSEVEWCDLLADEVRAAPGARVAVLDALRAGLKEPAFAQSPLDPVAADDLLEVAGSDHGLAITLWRLVADPQPEVRARGAAALERLAAEWYGPAPEGEAPPPGRGEVEGSAEAQAAAATEALAGKLRAAEEKLARGEARAEEARRKGDEAREKLQAQVKEARAEAAKAVAEAARAKEQAEAARQGRVKVEGELAAARATDLQAELQRLKGTVREAETARHAAEGQAERLAGQVARLEEERRSAEAIAAAPSAGPAAGEPAEIEPDEAPATWLLPVFTEEFYASMVGWDRRIQRAAVKQAFLLSQDHRHPSLRALPLGGLPGYYRVRVATDVRLIYRRDEGRQDAVEILSVIDREDLDRYVRQAKTR
jgi:hypothetical protein